VYLYGIGDGGGGGKQGGGGRGGGGKVGEGAEGGLCCGQDSELRVESVTAEEHPEDGGGSRAGHRRRASLRPRQARARVRCLRGPVQSPFAFLSLKKRIRFIQNVLGFSS
jgi:hypothetical protein